MSTRFTVILSLALPLAGCSSSMHIHRDLDENVLVDRVDPDGARVVYRLRPGQGDEAPRLLRDRHVTVKKVELLLTVGDINKDRAAKLGVEAWRGVFVERVNGDSNLAKAGLRTGDVLLAINGNAFTNARQFNELGPEKLAGAESLALSILRPEEGDAPAWTPLELQANADAREVRDTVRDTTKLAYSEAVESATGMRLAELSGEQSREVFGTESPQLVISSVRPGSPAYLAGFRARDRVVKLDGATVTSAVAADSVVREKLDGASDEVQVMLDVDGPLGSHASSVEVRSRIDESSSFQFPILWCYERDTDDLEWGFLQCIFLLGGRYERSYLSSDTRQIAMRSELELLPLGLFKFDQDPDESEVEFLWFIRHTWSK